jgi:DHA1 family purine base/nucleoside efflux pump-like MFS transporter
VSAKRRPRSSSRSIAMRGLQTMSPLWSLACGWLTLFVVGTDLFIISPLLPSIGVEFNLSAATTGLSVTVFSLTYLLSAPLIGQVADRTGRRRTLIASLLGFAVANLLTGLASDFGWLLAGRAAAGSAAAGISPLIYAGVGDAAPATRRATWMAIAVSGLLLALSVGAPTGTLVASDWGWRTPFVLLASLSVILIAANWVVWSPDSTSDRKSTTTLPVLDRASTALHVLPTVLWATALYGMYTFLGVWLTNAGLSSSEIAGAVSCYGVGALAGTLLGGQAADRFGSRKTMLTSLTGLAACLAALGVGVGTGWIADVMLVMTSIFAQLFFPAQQVRLARTFPQRKALLLALNNSALFLGISIGSLIGGQAMAAADFGLDAAMGAVIAGIALIVVAFSDRSVEAERQICADIDRNDHVVKLVDPTLPIPIVEWLLEPNTIVAAGPPERPEPNVMCLPVDELPASLPPFDLAGGLMRMNGNRVLLRKLIVTFGDTFAAVIPTLRSQISAASLDDARRLAHSLKGAAGTLEIRLVAEAARQTEDALASGNLAGMDRLLDRLEQDLSPALAAAAMLEGTSTSAEISVAAEVDYATSMPTIIEFRKLLHRRSLLARRNFAVLEQALGMTRETTRLHPVKVALDRLDYDQALVLLDRITGLNEMKDA